MTIQIKDLTVSNEIDMTAVRGGVTCVATTLLGFQKDLAEGKLNNPYTLIAVAATVDLDGSRCVPLPA